MGTQPVLATVTQGSVRALRFITELSAAGRGWLRAEPGSSTAGFGSGGWTCLWADAETWHLWGARI